MSTAYLTTPAHGRLLDRQAGAFPLITLSEAEAMLGSCRSGVYAFIRRRGFTAEEADDLTQEALIRAYTHLSGFRGTSMDAWLYRIAANVSVDFLRKRRLATVPLDYLSLEDSGEDDPLVRLVCEERSDDILS